jgi:hypothetical protein
MGSVADITAMEQVSVEYFGFLATHSLHLFLHGHYHPSSRTDTIGQHVDTVVGDLASLQTKRYKEIKAQKPMLCA